MHWLQRSFERRRRRENIPESPGMWLMEVFVLTLTVFRHSRYCFDCLLLLFFVFPSCVFVYISHDFDMLQHLAGKYFCFFISKFLMRQSLVKFCLVVFSFFNFPSFYYSFPPETPLFSEGTTTTTNEGYKFSFPD